jgi:transposase
MGGAVEELRRELARVSARVEALERENAELRQENAALRAENTALRQALDEARRAGKRQAGPFSRNNPKPNPKEPGRKSGAEYGAVWRRPVPDRIDRRIEVPCPLWCPCGGEVKLEGVVRQYQTDIPPVEPTTTEFAIQYGRCAKCGRRVQGRDGGQTSDATGAVGGVQIGPQAIALAAHLNKACGLSYERIMELFAQVFRLRLCRSALARAMLRLGRKAETTYEHLKQVLRNSRIVYPDETGWRVGGAKAWLWAMTTVTETIYLIERGRGFPEAAKILGELFAGILGCDGWAPYRGFTKAERQLCLAHLLRRCKELLEAPPTAECANYFEQIKAVLKEALALRDRRDEGTITPHGFRSRKGKIEASMDRLLDDPDLHDESIRFALHLLTNRDALFLFLDHPDLEATNHLAEKAIRPAVINRKTSGGNRTFNGAHAQAVIMSILRTAKLRSISAIDVLADMLRAPQPLLHPLMR